MIRENILSYKMVAWEGLYVFCMWYKWEYTSKYEFKDGICKLLGMDKQRWCIYEMSYVMDSCQLNLWTVY